MSDKSPLQMLAQTCSQIGADTGTKLTSGAADKVKMTASNNSGKNSGKCGSPTIVVSDSKPVPFKPYENTKEVTAKAVDSKRVSEASSKSASPHNETRLVTCRANNWSEGLISDYLDLQENPLQLQNLCTMDLNLCLQSSQRAARGSFTEKSSQEIKCNLFLAVTRLPAPHLS